MLFLTPSIGLSTDLIDQDTLKSALVAWGVILSALVFAAEPAQSRKPFRWHPGLTLGVVLALYAAGSALWSHSFFALVEACRWFILTLLMALVLNLGNPQNIRQWAWAIHGGAAVSAMWVVLQYCFDLSVFPQGLPQPGSTFFNRNFFSEYMACALPLVLWDLLTQKKRIGLVISAFSVALILSAVLMTGTRSALLAIVIYLPIIVVLPLIFPAWFQWRAWSRVVRLGITLGIVVMVAGLGSTHSASLQLASERGDVSAWTHVFGRAATLTHGDEYVRGSSSVRFALWKATARMALDNPIAGVGAGAWEIHVPRYQAKHRMKVLQYFAHNDFLQMWAEYGLLGALAIAFFLALLLKTALDTWRVRHSNTPRLNGMIALGLCSALGLCVVASLGFPLHLAACSAFLAMGLGTLFRLDTDQVPLRELRPRPSNEQSRWLLGWGLGVFVLTGLAGLVTVQAFRADYLLYGAMHKAAVYLKDASLFSAERNALRTEFLSETQAGMAINPHHRSTTTIIATVLSLKRDMSDAAVVLEMLAASRPYVAAFQESLVLAYSDLRDTARAEQHLAALRKLKPDTVLVDSLTVRLLIQKGDHRAAADYLNMSFGAKRFDLSMLQAGYTLGLKLGDHNLALRSLRLRNVALPQMASDTYFRIGMVYVDVHDQLAAVQAFRQGMDLLPASEKPGFKAQVPPAYRKLI